MSENDIHTLTITVNTSSKCGVVPPQARYHLLRVCEREQSCMCPRLCTKHELLRVWNPLWSSYCHWTLRQKISSRNYLPLNTLKHIKHGCLRCSSMMPFIAGLRNERPAVQRDNATSGAIITQVCGWDEGSKKASATGVPLRRRLPCCQKKKERTKHWAYITGDKVRIKNKRILEHTTSFTQETTSWICGRPCVFQLDGEALRLKRSEETADKAVKEHVSGRIHTSLQGWKGKRAVGRYQNGKAASAYW